LTFAQRGFDTVIGFFGSTDPGDLPCHSCLACATICPTGALIPKPELTKGAKSNP
jgi:ferredoxin